MNLGNDALRNSVLNILDQVSSQEVLSRAGQQGEDFDKFNLRQIGLDSLGLLELAIQLEEVLDVSLDLGKLRVSPESTVGELVQLARAEMSG